MPNSIEIEKKALISKKDYEKFLKYFDVQQKDFFVQTNYYFETDNFDLKKTKRFLRVRKINNKFVLTLKTPLKEGLLEKTQNISENQFEKFKNERIFPDGIVKESLIESKFNLKNIRFKTFLTTKRVEFSYKKGLLCLDENTYGNKIDYEIELEYNEEKECYKQLSLLFSKVGVPFLENKKSKTQRALLLK